jgi:hypothetical protein
VTAPAPRHRAPNKRQVLAGILARLAAELSEQAAAARPRNGMTAQAAGARAPLICDLARRCAADPETVPEDWTAAAYAALEGWDVIPQTDELNVAEIKREAG